MATDLIARLRTRGHTSSRFVRVHASLLREAADTLILDLSAALTGGGEPRKG